jgi:CRP/FNR family cyclic AMP-dependent transcriptional regulator
MSNNSIEDIEKGDRVNIPIIKYFWQASPLTGSKNTSFHKFLRNISCFDHFSDYELYLFTKFLHIRNYAPKEVVFKEGDGGFGFYLIFDGNVDIYTASSSLSNEQDLNFVTQLSKFSYFGELALLEQQNKRNATAISAKATTLLTIYKPDLEELIERYPVVGAKLLQGLSTIVSKRLNAIANELKITKEKLEKLEENASNEL